MTEPKFISLGCPICKGALYLWFDGDVWRIDTDDGMTGPEVYFCPECGCQLSGTWRRAATTAIAVCHAISLGVAVMSVAALFSGAEITATYFLVAAIFFHLQAEFSGWRSWQLSSDGAPVI